MDFSTVQYHYIKFNYIKFIPGLLYLFKDQNPLPQKSAFYIGRNTIGSGNIEIGQWSSMGYKAASDVFRINNSGSLASSHLTITKTGNVGINTDAPYDSMSIGDNRLHVYGDNAAVLVGDVGGSSNSAVRILGSRSTNDSGYIQAGTSAADTECSRH